jgi:hypothetical protein
MDWHLLALEHPLKPRPPELYGGVNHLSHLQMLEGHAGRESESDVADAPVSGRRPVTWLVSRSLVSSGAPIGLRPGAFGEQWRANGKEQSPTCAVFP